MEALNDSLSVFTLGVIASVLLLIFGMVFLSFVVIGRSNTKNRVIGKIDENKIVHVNITKTSETDFLN